MMRIMVATVVLVLTVIAITPMTVDHVEGVGDNG